MNRICEYCNKSDDSKPPVIYSVSKRRKDGKELDNLGIYHWVILHQDCVGEWLMTYDGSISYNITLDQH